MIASLLYPIRYTQTVDGVTHYFLSLSTLLIAQTQYLRIEVLGFGIVISTLPIDPSKIQ